MGEPATTEPPPTCATVEEAAALEALLPSQYFCRRPPSTHPERRLMIAVLHEALTTFAHCLGARGRLGRRQLAETEAWFASEEAGHPFSFVAICDALELDPSYLRAGLARWRVSRLPRRHRRRRRIEEVPTGFTDRGAPSPPAS
jgi:hypothetical protein